MSTKLFLSANEAAAHGVRLARPQVISAYPITPQTTLVEKLADFIANGELASRYMMVESEHSAMASALGACMMGARVFTATSSQGLLYMCEMLPYVSGGRFPIVMVDANRATATPWSILGDHRDSMLMRDSGFMQIYVESGQEALDTMIQSYRLAEDPEIMLPIMVNLDGFTLTHTYEAVEIPDQEDVDRFLPPYETTNKFSLERPMTLCDGFLADIHTEGRIMQCDAYERAKRKMDEIDAGFGRTFGRTHGGMYEEYKVDGAEYIVVALGSVSGTVRAVVDEMRAAGHHVGMLKIRSLRPFPKEWFTSHGGRFKGIGVIDRSISFGYEGPVYADVKSALYGHSSAKTANFICGLAGRDISEPMIEQMFGVLENLAAGRDEDELQFIGRMW